MSAGPVAAELGGPTVVKLGGSLLADPARLRGWLARLASGALGPCLIVPGGGPFADAVRAAQAALGFPDALAHSLALDAMGRMAEVFRDLEPGLGTFSTLPSPSAGEGGPRIGMGRVRGATVKNSAPTFKSAPPRSEAGCPSPDPLCGPPSPAEGGGSETRAGPSSVEAESPARVWDPVALRAGHPDIPESWDVTSDSLALWLARAVGAPACLLVKAAPAPQASGPADWARAGLVDAAFPAFAARYAGEIRIEGPAGGRIAA